MPDNSRTTTPPTTVTPYKNREFDAYLSWRATMGMIVTDTGGIEAMTRDQFCDYFNVDLKTIYNWSKIPDIELRINDRLQEIAPGNRVRAAFNRLWFIGMTSVGKGSSHSDQRAAVDALKTYLGHFGELKLPVQRQDLKVQGSLAEILSNAEKIIEGEVVDAPRSTDAS